LVPVGDGPGIASRCSLVDTLREEGDDSEKLSGIGPEFSEHRGGEGKFDRGCQAPGVLCVKHSCSLVLPFPGQSIPVPLVVLGNSGEQRDGERVEVKLFQDVVDSDRMFAVLVDAIERVACGLHRQCWDLEDLTVGRDGGDAGGDAKTDVAELSQLLHHGVDLPRARPLGSRMDSALSRTMNISFEDRNGRKGSDPRGFRCCTDDLGESTEEMGE
jgi:hypothetical protein